MGIARKRTPFEQSVVDAQKRARRKLVRLSKKGIITSPIAPSVKSLEGMTTGQKRAYKNELEKFISRDTRYVAGYQGTPISMQTVRAIREAEKKLNKRREKEWKAVRDKPVQIKGASMTVGEYRAMTQTYDSKSGTLMPNPKSTLYFTEQRHRSISGLKSEKAAKEYAKNLAHASTPTYEKKKMQTLRNNAAGVIASINEPALAAKIRRLTMPQLYELMLGDFVDSVFMNSKLPNGAYVAGIADHINDLIDRVAG